MDDNNMNKGGMAMGGAGPIKNPMFKSRVFVGNLRTDFLAKAEVEERFGKYGPVTGE